MRYKKILKNFGFCAILIIAGCKGEQKFIKVENHIWMKLLVKLLKMII